MAGARLTYKWADGDQLDCQVEVEASYPDAVAEARAAVVALLRDGIEVLVPGEVDGDGA